MGCHLLTFSQQKTKTVDVRVTEDLQDVHKGEKKKKKKRKRKRKKNKKKNENNNNKNPAQYDFSFQQLLNLHRNEAVYVTVRNSGHKQRQYHKRYSLGLMRLSLWLTYTVK